MKKFFVNIAVIVSCVLVVSCQRDFEEVIVTKTTTVLEPKDTSWVSETSLTASAPPLKIERLLESLAPVALKDSIATSTGGTIAFSNGVVVNFEPNFCGGFLGAIPQKVAVELIMLRSNGALIAANKPTVSNGQRLISAGAFRLRVSYNNIELAPAPNKRVTVRYDIQNVDFQNQFTLFNGVQQNRLQFNWTLMSDSARANVTGWRDSLGMGYLASFIPNRFNWINCDRFDTVGANLTRNFIVTLPRDSFSNANASVFVVFPNQLSVIRLEGVPSLRHFTIPQSYRGIPIGAQVKIVALAQIDNTYYLTIQNATVTANSTFALVPQPITLDNLRIALSQL